MTRTHFRFVSFLVHQTLAPLSPTGAHSSINQSSESIQQNTTGQLPEGQIVEFKAAFSFDKEERCMGNSMSGW